MDFCTVVRLWGMELKAFLTNPQSLSKLRHISWRWRALFVVKLVRYWQWVLWSFALAVFVPPQYLEHSESGTGDNPEIYASLQLNSRLNVETDSLVGSVGSTRDCWICYDSSRPEPLINPCRCTGDVAAVHHECLSRWLVESAATPDGLKCKVCNTPYIVEETNRVEWERGFTCVHWVRTALAVACMCGAGAAAWVVVQLFMSPVVRVLAAGAALLVSYIAIRFLSMNTVTAYQRAKVSSLKILTEPVTDVTDTEQGQLSTISRTVTVEIASKAVLDRALKGEVNK